VRRVDPALGVDPGDLEVTGDPVVDVAELAVIPLAGEVELAKQPQALAC
jgi:hypothetical protein